MKRNIIILFVLFLITFIYSQENNYLIYLSNKKAASINDSITLIRLLYNENDFSGSYITNINWALEKKLLKFTLPIDPDEVNQTLSRGEFAFLICKVFNTKGGLVNTKLLTKYHAFNICKKIGILSYGRGQMDTFTGAELIDTFNYLEYYTNKNGIKKNIEGLNFETTYNFLPKWRKNFYDELDNEKASLKDKRLKRKEKIEKNKLERANEIQKRKKIKKESEKFIDKENLSEPK